MVDTLFVCVDGSLGRCYASAAAYVKEDEAACLYDSVCGSWIPVRHLVCPGPGALVWTEFSRDACVDRSRAAVGFHSWCEQFLLWNPDRTGHIAAAVWGRSCKDIVKKTGECPNQDILLLFVERKEGLFQRVFLYIKRCYNTEIGFIFFS